ncbi:hypothetical protein ARMSODRAFT_975867 [Armillaria solidipes]|uniref:Uncharacterized protein n=1 Tax=Armillaria solidipes TaxID=1076256 RepID=A0A2H3BC63_9AGAR|nr:hypothetical protein ARMSODRAFT_975867 [Armillaria solidipes]
MAPKSMARLQNEWEDGCTEYAPPYITNVRMDALSMPSLAQSWNYLDPVTWLWHARFFVELAFVTSLERDTRCSAPSQFLGLKSIIIMTRNKKHFELMGILDEHATGGMQLERLWTSSTLKLEGKKENFTGYTRNRSIKNKSRMERTRRRGRCILRSRRLDPRWLLLNMHYVPEDSIRIFRDINVKMAIAMHWEQGLDHNNEEVMAPP